MEAIIARSAVGAKSPSTRKTTTKQQPYSASSEGDVLALKAAETLRTVVMNVTHDHQNKPRDLKNSHLEEVGHLLGRLLDPNRHERHDLDPVDGDILGHLEEIANELTFACQRMDETGGSAGETVPVQLILAGTLNQADGLANRITHAYKFLPGTLDELRSLTTFAGAKPHRERPTPPIRRDPPVTPGLKKKAVAGDKIMAQAPIAQQRCYQAIPKSTYDTIKGALWRAGAVVEVLSNIFLDEPGIYGEADLLGLILHAQWQIGRAWEALRGTTVDIDELNQKLFEARALISVIEAFEDAGNFKFQHERSMYCGYFEAISESILLASSALELVPLTGSGGAA